MFDGMKMQDVGLLADCNGIPTGLTFGALVDPQTGVILDPTRRAIDRGLTFRLVPRRTGVGQRVEVKGSLHKFYNNGEHNADQFTATDLLLTLDQLVTIYGIDPFNSKINTVEFGVNVVLPFPVAQILQNLICYKYKPFMCDTRSKTPYYECRFQRFTVKLYDKGKQQGLDSNLLRVEIKVAKMVYFDKTGVHLNSLDDLLTIANYRPLGALLVDTFSKILFDDPTSNPNSLTAREQEIYQNGRNPRYWQTPDNLTTTQANTHSQRLRRTEQRYRALLDKYRQGENRQSQTTELITQTWDKLTTVSDDLLIRIDERRGVWHNLTKPYQPSTCHELTGLTIPVSGNIAGSLPPSTCHELTTTSDPDLSRINPLYSELQPDTMNTPNNSTPEPVICPVTGIVLENPRPRQRFASAALLRTLYYVDRRTFDTVAAQFLTTKHEGANLDQQCYYMAHNIRNAHTNQFNNPLRRLKKYLSGNQRPLLFPLSKAQLTDRIQAGIEYRKGTRYEVDL